MRVGNPLGLGLLLFAAACATTPPPAPAVREGLHAVAGKTQGGFAWRLWVDPAAKAPQKVAVWMHPSRDSGEAMIEPLAPLLARHGYALLVPLKPEYHGWNSEDAQALFGQVLPDAAKSPNVNPQGPLVIGFSAGGQMALLLWRKAPDALGGLVLIGTAPLPPDALPTRALAEGTAVLSLVGETEPSAATWVNAAPAWLAAGVPLTLKVVAGRGHEWLVDVNERTLLETWLDAL